VPPHDQEEITPGEARAGMIVNGGGFAQRPLSLPPQFCANKSLDLLLRPGVRADLCNRFPLGRSLAEVSSDGWDRFVSARALAVCVHEGLEPRFQHLDTPRFSRTGAYLPDRDAHALAMTHGSAKDHRPDVQQMV